MAEMETTFAERSVNKTSTFGERYGASHPRILTRNTPNPHFRGMKFYLLDAEGRPYLTFLRPTPRFNHLAEETMIKWGKIPAPPEWTIVALPEPGWWTRFRLFLKDIFLLLADKVEP